MNAIKFVDRKKIVLIKTPIPTISHPREILIKVAYSGICGTDLHIIEGKFPCRRVILGHEFSGTIVGLGADVKNFAKGDRVVVDPNNCCHKCDFCRSKNPHFCLSGGLHGNLGTKSDGGWAGYCVCSMEQVHKIPDGISLRTAALVEPLSCVVHGWNLIGPIILGANVLVMGGGIIGSLWVCLLHLHGHKRVTVAEINPRRQEMLGKLCEGTACQIINPDELERGGQEYDVIVDCTGNCSAIELGISLLNRGGRFCVFGVAPPGNTIKISLADFVEKELTLMSVKINPYSFSEAVSLLENFGEKYFNYNKLGVRIFKMGEYFEAIEMLKKGTITKAVFQIQEQVHS